MMEDSLFSAKWYLTGEQKAHTYANRIYRQSSLSGPYISTMQRVSSLMLLAFMAVSLSGQSKPNRQGQRESCITALSTFAAEPNTFKPPTIPDDLTGVTMEYFASGCYGNCPAFKLRIQKDVALWEGHAYVKAKGKKQRKVSPEQFRVLVQAWLTGSVYAMRDDYCQPPCPDGTVMVITDVQDTSITLKTSGFTKTVSECYTTIDGKAQNPKPPEQYFRVSQELLRFAKSQGWL